MKKTEIRSAIKTVYQELWDLLSLYEKTEGFNTVPEGEEEDCWDYVRNRLSDVRKQVDTLFQREEELAGKLKRIIEETEYFAGQCEIPGVVTRWKQANPKLNYFDCAFDLMEKCPEECEEMRRGLTALSLSFYPDEAMIAERNAYFEEIEKRSEWENLSYSEDRIFQDELLNTLKILFEQDFEDYM